MAPINERPFEAEVDASRLLGDALARADEEVRACPRGVAPPTTAISRPQVPNSTAHSCCDRLPHLAGLKDTQPAVERLEQENHHEDDSPSGPAPRHRARACDVATCRTTHSSPPKRMAAGMIAQRMMPRDERNEDAGKAIPGEDRGIRLAMDGGDFNHARQPGRRPAEEARQRGSAGRPAVRRPAPRGYSRRPSARQNRRSCDP